MFKLACKSLGAPDCNFESTGDTKEEVVSKMKEHAAADHPAAMEGKTDEEVTANMMSAVSEE